MLDVVIFNEGVSVAKLTDVKFIAVEGVPVKADAFHIMYALSMNGEKIEVLESGEGRPLSTALVQIDLLSLACKVISTVGNGYIVPGFIEKNKIIYTKRKCGSSVMHEFEQDIGLNNRVTCVCRWCANINAVRCTTAKRPYCCGV